MNVSRLTRMSPIVWIALAIVLLAALLLLAAQVTGGIHVAGLNAFDPAFIPPEFSPWGIDANRFIY